MLLQKRNKGFTLYELTIVLAIIAIVGTLVASYITFLSSYQKQVSEYNSSMEEIYSYKTLAQKWFSHFDTADYYFSSYYTSSSTSLTSSLTDVTTDYYITAKNKDNSKTSYSLYLYEGKIYFEFEYGSSHGSAVGTGYNLLTINTEYITSLSFTAYEDDSSATPAETDYTIYKCTVGCPSGDITFLLDRHVEYDNSQ